MRHKYKWRETPDYPSRGIVDVAVGWTVPQRMGAYQPPMATRPGPAAFFSDLIAIEPEYLLLGIGEP